MLKRALRQAQDKLATISNSVPKAD